MAIFVSDDWPAGFRQIKPIAVEVREFLDGRICIFGKTLVPGVRGVGPDRSRAGRAYMRALVELYQSAERDQNVAASALATLSSLMDYIERITDPKEGLPPEEPKQESWRDRPAQL